MKEQISQKTKKEVFMTPEEQEQYLADLDRRLDADLDRRMAEFDAKDRAGKAATGSQPQPEPVVQGWTPESVDPLEAARKAYEKQKADLDKDLATYHREAGEAIKTGKNVDASRLPELQARADVLKAEQERIGRESFLKDNHKRKFLAGGIGTAADFEKIWNTKLREEALIAQAAGKGTQHSFWDEF